jgi:hypothetical protein
MKKLIVIFIFLFIIILPTTAFSKTNFNGTWETNWGLMYLTQKNNIVIGTYEYNNGKLKGTISGNKLTYTWNEYNNKYSYSGTGYFIIKKDNSLYGQWKNEGVETWEGEWTATRSNTKTI